LTVAAFNVIFRSTDTQLAALTCITYNQSITVESRFSENPAIYADHFITVDIFNEESQFNEVLPACRKLY